MNKKHAFLNTILKCLTRMFRWSTYRKHPNIPSHLMMYNHVL